MNSFRKKKIYSLGENESRDINILKNLFPDSIDIIKTCEKEDLETGVDYKVILNDSVTINVDGKTREKGSSKFWKYGYPELALETWSVKESSERKGKIGWTLDNEKDLDYILYTFYPSDSNLIFFLPFQQLKMLFVKKMKDWENKYGLMTQQSYDGWSGWESECIFVPYTEVLSEMRSTFIFKNV